MIREETDLPRLDKEQAILDLVGCHPPTGSTLGIFKDSLYLILNKCDDGGGVGDLNFFGSQEAS